MLLTCPSCSARYNVADTAIPAHGRAVHCVACGHKWQQFPDGRQEARDGRPPPSPRPGPPDVTIRPPKTPPAAHARMRKKAHARIRGVQLVAAAAPWVMATGLLAGGLVWAVGHRVEIVRAWPKTASAFALIGQPASAYGLQIDRVQVRAGVDAEGPRLMVGGLVRSISKQAEPVPYLQVQLRGSDGKVAAQWMVDPGVVTLEPGKSHAFETVRRNPPRGELVASISFAGPPLSAPRTAPARPGPPEPPTGKSGLMGAKAAPPAPSAKAETGQAQDTAPVTAR